MIKKEELLIMKTVVNPLMIREVLSIDSLLERIGEDDHHVELSMILANNETNVMDMGYQIQELYRVTAKKVITALGVVINEDVTLNVIELEDLLESIIIMFEPGNSDLFSETLDSFEDGQDFICDILGQLSERTYAYWFSVIDDFDIGSLSMIKRELEIPLTEVEQRDLKENEEAIRKFVTIHPNRDDINYSLTFITERELAVRFGYSWNVGMIAIDEGIEFLIQARQYDRLLKELIVMGLGSSIEFSKIQKTIEEFIEDTYIPIDKRIELLAKLDKIMSDFV